MGVNRVDFGGNTLIDLTGDTLESAEQLLKGIIAHARDGSQIVGALEAGGGGLEYNRLYPAATGTFTVTERTEFDFDSPYILQHDAGVIPILVTIISNGMTSQGDLDALAMWRTRHWNASYYDISRTTTLSVRRGSSSSSLIRKLANETGSAKSELWSAQSVPVFCYNVTLGFNTGKTYTWIAYGVD